MKTIASLLMRAKTLKRFGTSSAVNKQFEKIISHPDFETICTLVDSFQKLSSLSKVSKDVRVDQPNEDVLDEQDVLDLDLDLQMDADSTDDLLLDPSIDIDDHLEIELDLDTPEDGLEEILEDDLHDTADDLVIELDFDHEEESPEEVKEEELAAEESILSRRKELQAKANTTLKAKLALANTAKKIVVSKKQISAKKKSIS